MNLITISFTLNGKAYEKTIRPNQRVLDFLRDEMHMHSVKEGCGEGECGACTILLNQNAVTSCAMLVGQLDGATIMTLEGLGEDGSLDVLQQAFIEEGAVQCGYCTPGMILSAKALLLKTTSPTTAQIREAISGNLCRCTGYARIVKAITRAANRMRELSGEEKEAE